MKIFQSPYHGPCAVCGKNDKISTVVRKDCYGEERAIDLCLDHLQNYFEVMNKVNGYPCWFCQSPMIWQNDFNFEDCGMEGEGIVAYLSCSECEATVECRLPLY